MLEINDLYKYIVKVNSGSGIVINLDTNEKSYILTAHHCIEDSIKYAEPIKCLNDNNIEYKVLDKFFDIQKDIAILEIAYQDDLENILYTTENILPDDDILFMGYPSKGDGERKKLNGNVIEWNNKSCVNVTESINGSFLEQERTIEVLLGFSGSGIFKKNNQELYLIGIAKILSDPNFEYKEIHCVSIQDILTFIKNKSLPEFSSYELNSFENYRDSLIKPFHPKVKELLVNEIDYILSKDITPKKIINNLEEKLFYPYNNEYKNKIHERVLWEGWLFYLALISIYLDRELLPDEFIKIKNKKDIHSLFLDREDNFTDIIGDILRNNEKFNKKSTLLFNSKNTIYNKNYCFHSDNIIEDISSVSSDQEKMEIDKTQKKKKMSFVLLSNIKMRIASIDKTTFDEIIHIIKTDIMCKKKN